MEELEIRFYEKPNLEQARKVAAEEYPDADEELYLFKTLDISFNLEDHLGDGDVYITLEGKLSPEDREKNLFCGIIVNIAKLIHSSVFWSALEEYLAKEDKRLKRIEILRETLKALKDVK